MKKFFGYYWRETAKTTFQQRAIKKADKIMQGEKVIAPKHPTDERVFLETIKNTAICEELKKKDENLIQHLNKITIKSTDPPHRTSSNKHSLVKDDDTILKFEFGFYEPPKEQLEKGKLTFREAIEILRARVDVEGDGDQPKDVKNVQSSIEFLQNHPATKRISEEQLENIWRYFRPFVRQEKQKVVSVKDLDDVRKAMDGKADIMEIFQNPVSMIRELLKINKIRKGSIEEERFQHLEEEDQIKLLEQMKKMREEDFERLEKRMAEMRQIDEERNAKKKAKHIN